jgi:AcrR family transcriptional regulator
MGTKERREREREELRTLILDAARELFVNEGFEAVTMRRIADKIEYSPTAIYFHFKDKEALLRQLCTSDFLILAQQFARIARVKDPVDRLCRSGHAYLDFAANYPNHYRLMFMTPTPPIPVKDHEQIEHGNPDQDAYAFVRSIVEECIATGRFRRELKDAELIAQTVWAAVHGAASLQIAKGNDPWIDWRSTKKRNEAMVDLIVAGLVAHEE